MVTNFARVFDFGLGHLASGLNSTSTTVTLQEGDIANFPAPGASADRYRIIVGREIMTVTGRSEAANTLTVLRGQEGSTAASHLMLAVVSIRMTAAGFLAMQNAINTLEQGLNTIEIRIDSGGDVGQRARLNIITGKNIVVTGVDDSTEDEVELTFNMVLDSYTVAGLPGAPITGDMAFATDGRKWLGAAYGEISGEDLADTIATVAGGEANKMQVDSFDTDGVSNLTTPDHTNDHIIVATPGDYVVNVAIAYDSVAGLAARFGFGVYVNDGATHHHNLHSHIDVPAGAGGNAGSLGMSAIVTFAAADTVELWVWNETNGQDIVIDDITLSLHQISGIGEVAGAGTGCAVVYDGSNWVRLADGQTVVA